MQECKDLAKCLKQDVWRAININYSKQGCETERL